MELGNLIAIAPAELGAEELCEQVVVSVRGALLVERYDEQVAPLQELQLLCRIAVARERVTQRHAQFVDDAGVQQEGHHVLGQARQHVLAQELGDVSAGAGEVIDEPVGLGSVAKRQRREVERR